MWVGERGRREKVERREVGSSGEFECLVMNDVISS